MTHSWNKDDEHLTDECPRAPIVKAIWQDTTLYGKMIPEPNRYRLPSSTRRSPAHPGHYKLDADKV
jgi:hypothetical protein